MWSLTEMNHETKWGMQLNTSPVVILMQFPGSSGWKRMGLVSWSLSWLFALGRYIILMIRLKAFYWFMSAKGFVANLSWDLMAYRQEIS